MGLTSLSNPCMVTVELLNWGKQSDQTAMGWIHSSRTTNQLCTLWLFMVQNSCTSSYGKYPMIYRALYIPGGAGFLPSRVGTNISHSWEVRNIINTKVANLVADMLVPWRVCLWCFWVRFFVEVRCNPGQNHPNALSNSHFFCACDLHPISIGRCVTIFRGSKAFLPSISKMAYTLLVKPP